MTSAKQGTGNDSIKSEEEGKDEAQGKHKYLKREKAQQRGENKGGQIHRKEKK